MKAAYGFIDARSSFDHRRDLVITTPDPALVAPPFTTRLRRVAPYCPATWTAEVFGAGPTIAIAGNQRLAELTAVVKQRRAMGSPIGLDIRAGVDVPVIEPVLIELSTIGPLQLAIAVEGMAFPVAARETPAWVLERIRAVRSTSPSLPKRSLIDDLVRDANLGCVALQPVVEAGLASIPHAQRAAGVRLELQPRTATRKPIDARCQGL